MTKLTYMVGKKEVTTYQAAQLLSADTGFPVIPKYTSIVERSKPDPKQLAKIQAVFAKRRAEKMAMAESG